MHMTDYNVVLRFVLGALAGVCMANEHVAPDIPPGKNPALCSPAREPNDCAFDGAFTCVSSAWAANATSGQGAFGYCRRINGTGVNTKWACCQAPKPDTVYPPAPPRLGQHFPLPPANRPLHAKPNVVLFLTDDQDKMLGSMDVMNNTKDLFYRGGVVFDNFFVTTPICCPSRVSLLSARFAHSAGAVATTPAGWCGVGKYWKAPMQNKSVPTWMQNQGYRTGLFGKELNVNDDTYISPGWDTFFALGGSSEGHYYNDWFNDQGHRFTAAPGQYMTALIQERAVAFIKNSLQRTQGESAEDSARQPFFAYIAPHAPHTRATPMPGTDGYFLGWKAPRFASYNASLPDHHWLVRAQEPLTDTCVSASDGLFQNRLRALLGVDALVAAVANTIAFFPGELDNTYFLYTADHGFHLGEMRMPYFKAQPYDTDLRVPFMIRGPGIMPGSVRTEFAMMVDVGPTIAGLAGFTPPADSLTDGHSLTPLLFPSEEHSDAIPATETWRTTTLFEFWAGGPAGGNAPRGPYCRHMIMAPNNTYQGVRTIENLKYVDFRPYENIEEAFNITADPFEMHNLINDSASQGWIHDLRQRLAELRNCSQAGCWYARK
eukprot:m.428607 g.428607  ORF g.428607 m.428607 type:complete len:603 (+) comp21380_c1_seq4:98-1906(+)